MSNTDERIVQMRFDNKHFESNVQDSIKSLDRLKSSLNLDASAKSLSNLERAGSNFSLAGISKGIDVLVERFSILGIVGITAIQNITNSALNAGKRMVSALTIDPIKTGLSEYETKMDAIQTMMTNGASRGTTLEQVNEGLEELNEYADKTIYNFAQMTDNVGKFMAADISLEDSITSIKGLSNVAAGFGVDATKMAGATYQMSQALSTGVIQLQDWKSMEQAGMGGPMLQKELIATAKAMGITVDTTKKFRDTLQDGWLTSEVFVKTMGKMATDPALMAAAQNVTTFTKLVGVMKETVQSGWAVSWEKIIGDKDKSTELFTGISNAFGAVVGAAAAARNAMLDFWGANGGRDALLEGIGHALIGLASVMEPIEQAFRSIFPAMDGKKLVEMTKGFRDLMSVFKMGDGTAENLKRTFAGLFAVVDIGAKAFKFVASTVGLLFKAIAPVAGGLLSVTGGIGDFLVGLNNAIEKNKVFGTALTNVGNVITFVRDIIASTISVISTAVDKTGNIMMPFVTGLGDAIIASTFFSDALKWVGSGIAKFGTGIQDVFNNIKESISGFSGIDISGTSALTDGLSGSLQTLSISGDKVKTSFNLIQESVNKIKPILEKTGAVINSLFGPAIAFLVTKLKELTLSDVGSLLAGGGFFMIGKAIKDSLGSIKDITDGFAEVLGGITGALEAFQTKLKADAILRIAIAVGVLAASVIALSLIDEGALKKALGALTVMFTELSLSMMILQKASLDSSGMASRLIGLGIAVLLIATAMKKLGSLDKNQLSQGVEGLSAILMMLGVFIKVTGKSGAIQGGISGVIGISMAMLFLAKAIEKFGNMDAAKMQQGIEGISASLFVLGLFLRTLDDTKKIISASAGIISISVAMNIFASAVSKFGSIPINNLTAGITAMAASLAMVVVAMDNMPDGASVIASGVAMNLMAASLYLIAGAVAIFGGMQFEQLAIGLGSLAVALTVIAATAKLMSGALPGAIALAIMAGSIMLIVPALALLGSLSIDTIKTGLLALAGVFITIGLSSAVLAFLAPVILTLAIAIGILGVGIYGIGAGLVSFAAGLAAIAAGGAVFIAAFTGIVMAAINLIPMIAQKIGEGVVSFAIAIQQSTPEIMKAIGVIAAGLIKTFNDMVPPMVEATIKMVVAILQTLAEYTQPMVDAGLKILIGLLQGIADNLQQVVEVAIDVMLAFLEGIAEKLPDMIKVGVDVITAFMEGIGNEAPRLYEAGFQMIIDFINGMAIVVEEKTPLLIDAFRNLAGSIIKGLVGGLFSGIKPVADGIKKVANSIIEGFKDVLGIHSPSTVFNDFGGHIISGLVNGISDNVSKAINGVTKLGTSIIDAAKNVLGIHSPSTLFRGIGENLIAGLSGGIDDNADKAVKSSENMTTKVAKSSEKVVTKSNESAKKAFDKAVEWINDRKYYNKLSLEEELAEWQKLQAAYARGTDERKQADREAYRVKGEIRKRDYDEEIDIIDDLKYYGKVTLDEELQYWKGIQKKYKKGTDEREKADKEAFRVKQEIKKEEYDSEIERIDDLKYYNKLTLSEELSAWLAIQAKYQNGTEERKKADKEVYRLKKEITEKLKQLDDDYYANSKALTTKSTQDIKAANDAYEKAIEDRTKSLVSTYGLFDKVDATEAVSGNELTSNLQSQVNAMEEWKRQIADLGGRGITDELLSELEAMGPSATEQVKALNAMTEDELDDYIRLWGRKQNASRLVAIRELDSLRIETTEQINKINDQTKIDLDALTKTWKDETAKIVGDTSTQLATLETTFDTRTESITANTKKKFTSMAKAIKGLDWNGVGVNIVKDMESGILSQAASLAKTTAKVALQSLSAANKALGIKSPSKEFEKVGIYSAEGMIVGLTGMAKLVANSASNVGNTAISALTSAASSISDIINGNIDPTPTIRPVLDLSDVTSGNRLINSMFDNGKTRAIDLAGQIIQNGNKHVLSSDSPSVSGNGPISNLFNISSLVVREEADVNKIARELYNLQISIKRG